MCAKGKLCEFAHHLGELRDPGEQFTKTRNFNKWSGGEILPNKNHILDSMSWAIWGTAQGCDPPDWILKLHWRCTNDSWPGSPGFEYLQEVADVVERFGPKKPPEPDDVEGAEPHTADDVEGGAKTEGLQPHETWLSRKRMKSPSAAAPPKKKKKRHHHGTSKERHRDKKRHHHGTSNFKERHGDRDHCGISKEERRDCGHYVVSTEEKAGRCIIRAKARPRTRPREFPEVHGYSPESFPKEDHPTQRRARSIPQVRHPSQESYTSSSQESRSLSTLSKQLGRVMHANGFAKSGTL